MKLGSKQMGELNTMATDKHFSESAHIIYNKEYLYGDIKKLYDMAASLATIKTGHEISLTDIIHVQIAIHEAKMIVNKKQKQNYLEIGALYAILNSQLPEEKIFEVDLDQIEKAVSDAIKEAKDA